MFAFDIELELEPPGLVGGFEHHRDPFPLRQPVAELAAAKLVDPVGQRVAVVPRSGARLRSGWRGPRSKHREVYVALPLRRNLVMATTASGMSLQPPSVEATIKRRRPLRNVHKDLAEKITPLDRLALWITLRVGSMGFFLVIFGWTICWLGWNLLAPRTLQFDPPMAFVFWLFISNVIQILLMPLIMVGQNLLGRDAEARAEHDLEVNVRAEQEIEVILRHLEYQNAMLIAMVQKLGIDTDVNLQNNKR
jgi:uncharacterized membrane protein